MPVGSFEEETSTVVMDNTSLHNRTIHNNKDSSTIKSQDSSSGSRSKGVTTVSVSLSVSAHALANLQEAHAEDPHERQTALCFGSCCDVRTACLIVNCVYVCFVSFGLYRYSRGGTFLNFIDGRAKEIYSVEVYNAAAMTQMSVGLVASLLGLVGAYRFQKPLVLTTAVWYCLDALVYFVFLNWLSGLIIALYSYPHFALYRALVTGTMTRENYRGREKHCCCGKRRGDDEDEDDDEEGQR